MPKMSSAVSVLSSSCIREAAAQAMPATHQENSGAGGAGEAGPENPTPGTLKT